MFGGKASDFPGWDYETYKVLLHTKNNILAALANVRLGCKVFQSKKA